AHHLVGRNGGVEATGHQHQALLQRTERVATNALMLGVHHIEAVVANLDAYLHLGILQVDTGGAELTTQVAAHVAGSFHGAEAALAAALAAHTEDLARQLTAEVLATLVEDVVEVAQRVIVYFQEVRDARHATQPGDQRGARARFLQAGLHLQVVPLALHLQLRVKFAQNAADILPQLADELLAH